MAMNSPDKFPMGYQYLGPAVWPERERDNLCSENKTKQEMIDLLSARCQMWADRVTRLKTELADAENRYATLRAATVPEPPSPAPNPFRDFGHDPRKMGPL
jgi:hypothetical protein